MKTRMSSPLRKMPDEVLASIFRIIQYHEEEPQHHNLDQLAPSARRRIIKHVKNIAEWLNNEGLRVSDLVAVLAVPTGSAGPMFVFSFDKRAGTDAVCEVRSKSKEAKKTNRNREV